MRPGQPERIEYEYKRHGIVCLIGNWDVVLDQMIAPTIRETRTEEDFAWHIHQTIETDPAAGWADEKPENWTK
ncbi:MAG: transposase [Pirellulaceae bacterium]